MARSEPNAKDRELATAARAAGRLGRKPTAAEAAALRRVEAHAEEQLRWKFYGAIPQKHWREMSGRQAKVINEQAVRYGIPFGGASVSLPDVVRGLHDFLAANAVKLAGKGSEGDDEDDGSDSPALERLRLARARIAEIELAERRASLVHRERVIGGIAKVAGLIREAGERLQIRFGPEAGQMLDEALDEVAQAIEEGLFDGASRTDVEGSKRDAGGDSARGRPGVSAADGSADG